MGALTEDRDTPERKGQEASYPVAAAKKIFMGSLVVLSATGYAEPGATALNLTAAGRAEEQVDNSGGADGALDVEVRKGIFKFANDGADAITIADVGKTCYITDDQTVCKTDGAGTKSAAGTVYQVDSDGVWVKIV